MRPGLRLAQQVLWQRVVTALVLAPAFLALLFYAPLEYVAGVLASISLLAGLEWLTLAGVSTAPIRALGLLVLAAALLAWWQIPILRTPWLLLALVWWLLAAVAVVRYPAMAALWNRPLVLLGSALIVLPTTCGALVAVQATHGPLALLLLLVIVWCADIGAYFAGRALGRRKLAPLVSPGKTWEGACGGMLLALVVSVVMAHVLDIHVFPSALVALLPGELMFAVLIAAVVVLSIFGDLTESMLKRARDMKDSGGLLPGHGGVLDRIDSLLSTAPVWALLTASVMSGGA